MMTWRDVAWVMAGMVFGLLLMYTLDKLWLLK
jgi:hypothetical protein